MLQIVHHGIEHSKNLNLNPYFNLMKKYFYCLLAFAFALALSETASAQGCVAVKNMSSCSMNWGTDQSFKGWQASLNYRYFRSYKHFRGKHEETERVENGTEVINNDNSVNLGLTYTFNSKWSVSGYIPYIWIDRSSLYEHQGNPGPNNPIANPGRYHTQSTGFGDLRLLAYLNSIPEYHKGSLILGLGVKLPTGNYHVKDYFQKGEGPTPTLLPVDQSIQLGDGGTGVIAEVDFSHLLKGKIFGYINGMYMVNPRNTNGVIRSANLTAGIPLSNEMSVPDQYMARAGARYSNNGIQASLGGRLECIPSEDLIGKSDGFRRPGYIISAEPSVFYTTGNHTFGINVPIALERNRTQNTIDKERTRMTNTFTQGDAAFADWLLSVSYAYRFAKRL
jgi:hypothetical protein